MTNDIDLDGLEKLAKAATPGPWTWDELMTPFYNDPEGRSCGGEATGVAEIVQDGRDDAVVIERAGLCDAAYIAAANPATVLALIALARREVATEMEVVAWVVTAKHQNRNPSRDLIFHNQDGAAARAKADMLRGMPGVSEVNAEPLTPLAPAQAEIERLQRLLDDATASLNTAEGQRFVARQERDGWIARALAAEERVKVLSEAGQAVVDRWDTPLWKDVEPTAAVIGRLRAALAALQQKGEAQ